MGKILIYLNKSIEYIKIATVMESYIIYKEGKDGYGDRQ